MYDVDKGVGRIKEACDKIGRDPSSIALSMFYARGVDTEVLKSHADVGAKRGILPLPSEGADIVLPLLDKYAAITH